MEKDTQHTLFITGGAGYVGAMLCDQFSKRPDVKEIIGLDVEPQPELLKGNQKVQWIIANTSDDTWQSKVSAQSPDVVIHCAWHIREMYGNKKKQWEWNVEGSRNVFDFALKTSSVKKLIHFSSASVYGAYPSNTFEHRFTEDEDLRENEYLYGIEKRVADEGIKKLYEKQKQERSNLQVVVVRPAAITGPRGRNMRHRFGLQSVLSGKLEGSFIYKIIRVLVSFMPATKGWCRQFVHEDDIVDIVALCTFDTLKNSYDVFNLTPPGTIVRADDMARAVGRKKVLLHPQLVRLVFFWFWHLTRGKIPTSKGGWKFYSYPVVMDGSKITTTYGYRYSMDSLDAFTKNEGHYAEK